MPGPKISQQNLALCNTQPQLTCRLPVLHPGAMSSPDKHDGKENVIHQTRPPSSITPWSSSDAHVFIVGFFRRGRRQHGHCVCSVAAQPCIQQIAMHSVFRILYIMARMNVFSHWCSRSFSVGLDQTGQPLLPTHIDESWAPMSPLPVHQSPLLRPYILTTEYWNRPSEIFSFGDSRSC